MGREGEKEEEEGEGRGRKEREQSCIGQYSPTVPLCSEWPRPLAQSPH